MAPRLKVGRLGLRADDPYAWADGLLHKIFVFILELKLLSIWVRLDLVITRL